MTQSNSTKSSVLGTLGVIAVIAVVVLLKGLTVIPSGHVGVLTMFGKVDDTELGEGMHLRNPLKAVTKYDARLLRHQEKINVPTSEGVMLDIDYSVQYKLIPDKVSDIHQNIADYESILADIMRNTAYDIVAQHKCEEFFSEQRGEILKKITEQLKERLVEKHIDLIEALARDIDPPETVKSAINEKLQERQLAEKMEFTLEKERLEAERKEVEGEGIAKANAAISDSLTPEYIQWYRVDMLRALIESDSVEKTIMLIPESMNAGPTPTIPLTQLDTLSAPTASREQRQEATPQKAEPAPEAAPPNAQQSSERGPAITGAKIVLEKMGVKFRK